MTGRFVQRIACSGMILLFTLVSLQPSLVFASGNTLTIIAQYRQQQPVTLDLSSSREISTLDPTRSDASDSVTPIENLFLRLTDHDPVRDEIIPELATNWTVSNDGLVWTFHLRDDVNWIRYDPENREAEVIRPVVADDFVYGVKRSCDGRARTYFGKVIARVIAGCDVVNEMPVEEITETLVYGDTVQVVALDDTTLQITLQRPVAYFLSITTMWVMAAVPSEAIEMYGDEWTLPGNVITNGPYFVQSNIRGVGRTFVRNHELPSDLLFMDGNIVVVNTHKIEDGATAFALYQGDMLDSTGIPSATQQGVLVDYAADMQALQNDPTYNGELRLSHYPVVFYFAYTHRGRPFNNVHVRRAFSAIIDRELFILEFQQERGVPMIHFTPPGMVHALPLDEVGVGFDPEYARAQMALAGYPNCEGLPIVEIETYSLSRGWGEYWVQAAVEHLGCDIEQFTIIELVFTILLGPPNYGFDVPFDRPNATTLGWAPDFPDAYNWVNELLHCESNHEGGPELFRECSTVDDLMDEAAVEIDPSRRAELYRQIEEAFFGGEGEYPIAPIFMRAEYYLVKTWYTGPFETDGLFNGVHWEAYSIDMAAKLAARGE